MVRPTYLVLHKTEWDRLQRQSEPPTEEPINIKQEYLKALTEKSREWMKTWPDSVSGHIAQLEKQKKKQHQADIAFMKTYTKKIKEENTAGAIKEARQLIFEDSSYGRKLISALLESRALEEREAQINFQKELQQKAAEIEKERETPKKGAINDFHDNDAEREKLKKLTALECDRANKESILLRKEKELQISLEEKKCAIESEKFMKQVIEIENKEKEDIKRCEKLAIEEYEADKMKLAKVKAQERKLDEALTNVHKKGQDRIRCKIREVLKKVHQGRQETKWSKNLYEKIDQKHIDENKRYEDFINSGIKRCEERIAKKETKDMAKEKQKRTNRIMISLANKIAAEEERIAKKYENNKKSDRQTIAIKTSGRRLKKTEKQEKEKLTFLAPCNKLVEELKKREKEPSPWNGTKSMHEQFAQQADDVLKEIKHKCFARKVVDEYRKLNCLDAATLPVPNY